MGKIFFVKINLKQKQINLKLVPGVDILLFYVHNCNKKLPLLQNI